MDVGLLFNGAEPHTNPLFKPAYRIHTRHSSLILLPLKLGIISLAPSVGTDCFLKNQNSCLITMPLKRSKRIAEKSSQADPPAGLMTPEDIAAALEQLMEGQRQAQQQIEALLAQQGVPRSAATQPRSTEGGRAAPSARSGSQEAPRRTEGAREVINNRRAARGHRPGRGTQLSDQGDPARSHGDLRHMHNRNRARTESQSSAPNEEKASTSDPTYLSGADRDKVEARIEELDWRIGRMVDG